MNLPIFKSNDELPLSMNAKDVAGYLNVSITCAYNLMNSKDFPTVKVGRRLLVAKSKFLQWFENADNSQER